MTSEASSRSQAGAGRITCLKLLSGFLSSSVRALKSIITTTPIGHNARLTHSSCAIADAGTPGKVNGLPGRCNLAFQHEHDRPSSREAIAHQEDLVCRASTSCEEHGKPNPPDEIYVKPSQLQRGGTAANNDVNLQTAVKAAMPQLVPFYFVNEVTFTFTILPLLIYVFSKYILPRNLRLYAARLFTSKL